MICFPNAKINLGLNILSMRPDGYHNIETVFYPIKLTDILEFTDSTKNAISVKTTGLVLDIPDDQNICMKAYGMLSKDFSMGIIDLFLHKVIPSGAGLGGGSADAAFFIKYLNNHFRLGLTEFDLEKYAAIIGSDCAFFIKNKPVFASGRGEQLELIKLDLSNYYIYIIKPDVLVDTAQAYSRVTPVLPEISIKKLINRPIEEWKDALVNDFEKSVFPIFPDLGQIKEEMYQNGATYASMSGSGSSIYGIFKEEPIKIKKYKNYFNWISQM